MTTTLFTIGYQKRNISEFIELLRAAEVNVVVDVRETAWSHKVGFSKQGLAKALAAAGIAYEHASFAGNPKWLRLEAPTHAECLAWYEWYLGEFVEIVDCFDALVGQLFDVGKRVCIVCFERHPGDCHRRVLADMWSARARASRRVQHIAPDGCPRLAPSESA
jgi:uncharacterized protein (DUF488 family)